MVTNVTNLSRSGLYDWMAQRVSAVVLAAYFLFLIGYVVAHQGIDYTQWHGLFSNNAMRIFSLLALVATGRSRTGRHVDHCNRLPDANVVRQVGNCDSFPVRAVCGVAMFAYFVWGVQILWGI